MKLFSNRWYLNFLLLAILLRLLIMPFFYHPDIKTYHFQASFLRQGVWNIYSYLPAHKDQLPLKEEFVYFPLTYFTLGAYQTLALPFLGADFVRWVSNASISSVDTVGVFRYLFILKLPYLLLDILTGFFLIKLVDDEVTKKRVFLFWLFNPFSILILYVFSNVDIFPVFLSVVSLFFVKKNNWWLAGLMLGLGASFKAYPLLFVPLLFFLAPQFKDKISVLLGSILTFLLIIAPFFKSVGFQQATLNSGLTTRIISNGIPIGFGEMLYPGIILLGLVYFLAWQKKWNLRQLPIFGLALILAVFITIHFHIQWLLWAIPFSVLILAYLPKLKWQFLGLILLALAIPVMYDDSSMSVSTLSVVNLLFENIPTPFKVVQHFYDPLILQSIFHSLFFGLSIITIWEVINHQERG